MKIGLVLEGGASRALFSAGVMDSFLDNNINADFVVGVSAGICNGMSYVSGQKGKRKSCKAGDGGKQIRI